MSNNQNLSGVFSEAGIALQQGNGPRAEALLARVLEAKPKEPTALYLMAAARKMQGDHTEAVTLYQKSLDIDDTQPETHNSFGNLLKELGRFDEALRHYEAAIRQKPGFTIALTNLALTEQARGNHARAGECLAEAALQQPSNPAIYTALGISQAAMGDPVSAVASYRQALALNPDYINALHNMGVAYRILGEFEEALRCFSRVIKLSPKLVEPRYIKANIHYELGQFDEADVEYRTAIGLKPDYLDAHVSLNNLYWEHGRMDVFTKSYEVGIKAAPGRVELYEHYLAALEQAERLEEARDKAKSFLEMFPEHPGLWRRVGRLSEIDGDMERALEAFTRAVDIDPKTKAGRMDAARALIFIERYDEALTHLDVVEGFTSNDQEVLAYQGLCWRLMGDERHEWLNDYQRFVRPITMDVPTGYSTVPEFLEELEATLRNLHTAKNHPIDQTLRGGSQTHGLLLDRSEPVIQKLKSGLHDCVADFVSTLPNDKTHPLLSRNTGRFDFSASWSVWLRQNGFHVNHVHSMGWLSSSFYVTVPDNTTGQDKDKEGWIKFGESGLMLGEREKIGRLIKPEAGMLALFPSYMWHGTVPYSRPEDRITTPFDVVPGGV